MDALEKEGKIDPSTRMNLLANRLVLIVPAGMPPPECRMLNTESKNAEGKILQSSEFFVRCSAAEIYKKYGFVAGQESLCLPRNQENTRSRIREARPTMTKGEE